jgi:formylmethanofuran dehydrogenase subunit B
MGDAWIDGRPVALELAIAQAARWLGKSRLPLIAGLGTDIAGTRAAVALADRIGGVVDHMHAETLLRDAAVMREAGAYLTTPNEARLRADTLLLVGPGLTEAWPNLAARLLTKLPAAEIGTVERRIFWLCPGKGSATPAGVKLIGRQAGDLPALLAVLRAHLAGRPAGKVSKSIAELATALQAARFGVAVWSAAILDELAIEMLFGLIDDLNAATRFSGLPLSPGDNAHGVMQTCGWMTGFPMRTGFGRGYPEHDPWHFDATRLVEEGEADCVLWISSYRAAAPGWKASIPVISLAAEVQQPQPGPHVTIQVGRPALDHDSVEHDAISGMIVARAATQASALPSVAEIIGRINAALPKAGVPC